MRNTGNGESFSELKTEYNSFNEKYLISSDSSWWWLSWNISPKKKKNEWTKITQTNVNVNHKRLLKTSLMWWFYSNRIYHLMFPFDFCCCCCCYHFLFNHSCIWCMAKKQVNWEGFVVNSHAQQCHFTLMQRWETSDNIKLKNSFPLTHLFVSYD